mmetsp:Transcript_20644/g.57865  ORF Transcript_20644/g.57865 Transcript_20644/m.57865 type:complete len:622 (-) Transcript_20644:117-1982(-)
MARRIVAALVCLCAPCGRTQNASENVTCVRTPGCCGNELRREALWACRELENFQISEARCERWLDAAEDHCRSSCGDCAYISKGVYDQCLFYMQTRMARSAAINYCTSVQEVFEKGRCPAACIDKVMNCSTPAAVACDTICGNYNEGCDCFRRRGTFNAPDTCGGVTVLQGPIPGSGGVEYSCDFIPQTCKSHWLGTECGFYKHCPVNICTVRKVSCPNDDTCKTAGSCAPSDGKCYYNVKENGEPCDDGLHYTHDDTCLEGTCHGIVDVCMRDEVVCLTDNPCLNTTARLPRGCDPPTGHCIFDRLPEGTPCTSPSWGLTAGRCVEGLCRRHTVDLCANKTCDGDPGQCLGPAECDAYTGQCRGAPRAEGTPCDDGRADTRRDRCVEGRCVGDFFLEPPYFHLLVDTPCSNQSTLSARRYYADVPGVSDCERQCLDDPECIAFDFGHHSCSIYGARRLHSPSADFWGREWVLATTPLNSHLRTRCYEKRGESPAAAAEFVRSPLFYIVLCLFVCVPLSWVGCRFRRSLCACCCRAAGASDPVEDNSAALPKPLSPKGSSLSVITAAPTSAYGSIFPSGGKEDGAVCTFPAEPPDPRGRVEHDGDAADPVTVVAPMRLKTP